ncbi:DUF748 domain-containing protein [Anditalea andensis]|uniref:DUF748 domain-containing protein n=1 Tax=Anditalea andensis TaxID=1048983 RepID=A0A074KZG5_9BACT|nr:DUF748 domain-containing protein [Anditalea andensis]KEO75386.1 hypothetical protein EL17_02275 [Anditalea andensis]
MKKRIWIPVTLILLIFLLLHFALEPFVLKKVNRALATMDGMYGSVDDIHIHLYRGAYKIDSLVIFDEEREDIPFFSTAEIDISLEWGALFKGKVVGDIHFERPILNLISNGQEVEDGEDVDFAHVLDELMPININTFTIHNGEIHYIDPTASPKVDLFFKDLNVYATNLGNVNDDNRPLPSAVSINASTIGGGFIDGHVDLNILKSQPDFDAVVEMDRVDLLALNEFTEAYANFTFKEGQLYASTEIAMKDGVFQGYLKPVFENVKVIDLQDEDSSFLRKAWEVVVGSAMKIFENPKEDQVATRVPFEGDINETNVRVMPTIFNVLRNAFIEAFSKSPDHDISFENL